MLLLARALAAAACLLPLALPAGAHAALTLTHVQADAIERAGNGDDVVTPGDDIRVFERISTATALTGANGTLFTPTPGVTISAATAPYADAAAGGQSVNAHGFEGTLDTLLPCGANVSFFLAMDAAQGQGGAGFTVPTGARGPLVQHAGNAAALGDNAITNVAMQVPTTGRVKAMEVALGAITHPRLADLRLELVAPDGHVILLADAGMLTGANVANLVFADGGVPITGGAAPYSGRFAPAASLSALEGRVLNGTWNLRVTDTAAGQQGTLDAWRLDAAKAYCSGIPKARFTMDAVPPRVTPGSTVNFDATTSSDSGGNIVSYEWDTDGDGQFDDGTGTTAQDTYPDKAKVPVKLRVTDNDGLTDVETQNLAVTLPPVAALSATPSTPLTGETVRLSAAGSDDPDGTIVNYRWQVEDDTEPERDTQGVDFLDISFPQSGAKSVTVIVTDEDGAEDSHEISVNVQNRPPVADIADPGPVVRDQPVTLSAEGSTDPEEGTLGYTWDLDNNGTYETSANGLPTLEHTFTTHGLKTIGLRVIDDKGASDTAVRSFLVTRAPDVDLTATPNPVSLHDSVVLDATAASDPDDANAVLTWEWDLDGDADDDWTAGPPTRTTSWATEGTRTVKVRVTDESLAATVVSLDVVVRNIVPAPALAATPSAPKVGETTQLSAVGSTDPDGTVTGYEWDLDGDESYELDTGTSPAASASFANAGNVTVGVRVSDDDGGAATKRLTFTVLNAATGGTSNGGAATGGGDPAPVAPATDPGAGGTTTDPAGGPVAVDPPVIDPERPFGAWLGGTAIQRTKQVLSKGLLLSCRSEPAVWCALTVWVSAKDARKLKLGRKLTKIASSALPVPAGRSARGRIKLTAKARRALRGKGVRLLVRAVARAADGREVALTRVILLRV